MRADVLLLNCHSFNLIQDQQAELAARSGIRVFVPGLLWSPQAPLQVSRKASMELHVNSSPTVKVSIQGQVLFSVCPRFDKRLEHLHIPAETPQVLPQDAQQNRLAGAERQEDG